MDIIDLISKVFIPICGILIAYVAIPYFKQKTTVGQREEIYFWVQIAVNAAEQIFNHQGQGKDKKEYVIEFLKSKGFEITTDDLDNMIESAVKELNLIQNEWARG